MGKTLNFDATKEDDVRSFIQNFFDASRAVSTEKNDEFQRVYEMYKLVQDMEGRDPSRANIYVPKLYSTVETIIPVFVDALLGIRPYFPIELKMEQNSEIGDIQTSLLDSYLDDRESQFFEQIVKSMKYVLLYGTTFIEQTPFYMKKTIKRFEPEIAFDFAGNPAIVGQRTITEEKNILGLKTRAFPPWQIYRDPFANSIEECRGLIKFRGLVSARKLKEMAANNPTGFPDFDPEKLDSEMKGAHIDNWSRRMASDIGVPLPKHDDDVGILLSYESNGRFIDMWNGTTIMRDNDNPYASKKINLTRIVNSLDPNNEEDWYGIGEGKPMENLCYALNDNVSQRTDHHNMRNQGVLYYDEDAISVDQMVMIGGNRIPVTPQPGQRIEDAVHERPMADLPPAFYNIPAMFEEMIDDASGVREANRGEQARHTQTAREATILKQAGDSRMKLKIKMTEQMGFKDIAVKSIGHIEQFATPDDIVHRIGLEDASKIPTVNPAHIEGGHSFSMKGSSRMNDALTKAQNAKDIFQLMRDYSTINQSWLANHTLELMGVDQEDRRKAVLPDANALQLDMLKAQISSGGGGESTRLISNGSTVGGVSQSPLGRDHNEKLTAL